MWTVAIEPFDAPDSIALLREYYAELTVRWFNRPTTDEEVDLTLTEYWPDGVAAFFVLRRDGEPAGHLGLMPDGEVTRVFVSEAHRRQGGARALLTAAEDYARAHHFPRLYLDTRKDLIEARALYADYGFTEIPPQTETPNQFQDHWFELQLT